MEIIEIRQMEGLPSFNITGSDNTANGYSFALYQQPTGINNTATGSHALFLNTTKHNNRQRTSWIQ
jgi:hypothetical protein